MLCDACNNAILKWIDSKPSEVLPQISITYGSGAAYDHSIAGVVEKRHARWEQWRDLVRENKTAIKAACAAGHHATEASNA
jgi:hypothetical protein